MKANDILYTQRIDEKYDFLDYTLSKLKGLFGDYDVGRSQTIAATRKVLSLFQSAMGRRNQTFKDVTWGTLIKFLSNPTLLGLDIQDVMQIVNNTKIKQQVIDDWNRLSYGTVKPDSTWSKKDEPIAPGNNELSAKLAEVVVNYMVEFAAVEYLERRLGGGSEEEPAPVPPAPAPAAPPPTSAAPGPPPAPAPPGPLPSDPQVAQILNMLAGATLTPAQRAQLIQELKNLSGTP